MRIIHWGVLGVIAALLAVAPTALAATTIGSDLSGSGTPVVCGDTPTDECTVAQTVLPGRPVTAPTAGVIVRWRVRDSSGALRLRVIRPVAPGVYEGAGTSATVSVPSGVPSTFDTRLPVNAGDHIGIDLLGGAGLGARLNGGAQEAVWFPLLQDGQQRAPDGTNNDVEDLYNADIEPDADRDGFGDETQDLCSKDPGTQGLCPGPCSNDRAGTEGNDSITGTSAGDRIVALGGDDTVDAVQGDDCLSGGNGNDRLNGGVGVDSVLGDAGDDTGSGGDGNDRVDGGLGIDILTGGIGDDTVLGGAGNDKLSGDSGADKVDGGAGRDKLSGGTGNDILTGGTGNDTISGGQGKNRLSGGAGNDILNSVNGKPEIVSCGSGRRDVARVDKRDRVRGCERVIRAR